MRVYSIYDYSLYNYTSPPREKQGISLTSSYGLGVLFDIGTISLVKHECCHNNNYNYIYSGEKISVN